MKDSERTERRERIRKLLKTLIVPERQDTEWLLKESTDYFAGQLFKTDLHFPY